MEKNLMSKDFHGHSVSAVINFAWRAVCRRHTGARTCIAELAFTLYQQEIHPQFRTLKIAQPENPESGVDWEKCLLQRAKKIDDFVEESRTINWRDNFEIYVARAIDQIYGYNFTSVINNILFPPDPVAFTTEDLHHLLQKSAIEDGEAMSASIQLFQNGLDNNPIGDLEFARREIQSSIDAKQQQIAAIDNAIAMKRHANVVNS